MSEAAQGWLSASDNDRHCTKAFDAAISLPVVQTGARSMQAAISSRAMRSTGVHTFHVAVQALKLKFGEIVKEPGQLALPPKKRVWAASRRLQKTVLLAEPPPVPEVPPAVPAMPPPVPDVPPAVAAVPPADDPPPAPDVPPAVPAVPPADDPPPDPEVPPPLPLMFCMQAPATHEAVTPHAAQAVPFEPHAEAELPV